MQMKKNENGVTLIAVSYYGNCYANDCICYVYSGCYFNTGNQNKKE